MANIKISQLTAAASTVGTQEFEVNESGTSKKVTGSQIKTFVKDGLVISDITSVTATAAELNYISGVTSAIQTQINAKAALAGPAFTGQASFADGSAAAPSIAHTGDLNAGLFFPAADTVAVSTAGTERMRVDSSGNVGIGTSSPLAKLSLKNISNVASINLIPEQGSATGYLTTLGLNVSFNGTNWVTVGDGGNSGASAIGTAYGDAALQFFTIPTTASSGQTLTPAQFYATERFRIASAGQIGIGGANYGTSGQVLTSGGSGAAPSWSTIATGGMTLLGTLTTTSGTTQTLSGLDLTSYDFLIATYNAVSTTSNGSLRLASTTGSQLSAITSSIGNGINGIFTTDLTTGRASSVSNDYTIGSNSMGIGELRVGNQTHVTTASTSITFGMSAGSFDNGSISIYGVK